MFKLNQESLVLNYFGQLSTGLSKGGNRQTSRSWFDWLTTIGLRPVY